MARQVGAEIVATNDLHYTRPDDAKPHDVLLCIQQQKLQSDTKRLRFDSEDFYLKSPAEMRRVFADLPVACDNTLVIAERVTLLPELEQVLVEGKTEYRLPRFDTPGGEPLDAYLRELVDRGAADRYGEHLSHEVVDRLEHELSIIGKMGFEGYFLIVWDLIRFAREQGIRVGPGRGSAAGSVVSYVLRITDLDPLRYGLLFERFLNPDRIEMPDIDMDFDERRRDEVIRYATEKYGSDHVAQIVTFQTIKGKQGIRDAARVLGFPPRVGDELCKMYPPAIMGRDEPIDSALQTSPELREAYERQPEAKEIIDTARALEGLRREDSVHAAGVVIGDKPLVNYLPLKLTKDSRDDAKKMVTQFDMNGVAQLGLLKMDFLGLRNLSVIEETLRHLRARGVELDIDHVPLDDEATYEMLRRGDTIGVFQMESPGMKNLIKVLEPDRFEDLMALVALYRPGLLSMGQHNEYAERKHGRKKVTYPHPDLEPVLADTYGIIVYQEQVMQTAVAIAGFSMGEADTLRKVMGKKIREKVAAEREKFVAGAVALGRERRVAEGIFEYIEPFADYGFNASHACAYGYVAYQTAYLMAHHPVEYMAAILTSVKDDKDRKPYYLYACRGMDIEVLPPDVNESDMDFAPAPGDRRAIRYGLSAVRNVGQGVVQSILEARAAGGPFTSFGEFCRRVEPTALTRRVLESLIFAGAFGSLGYTRGGMLQQVGEQAAFEKVAAPILAERKAEAAGQFSLFGGGQDAVMEVDESVLDGAELDKRLLLSKEKEMLGQFVTDHPLLGIKDQLAAQTTCQIPDLEDRDDGELVVLGGIIGALARKFTKRGEPYAQFRLEGLTGGVEVVAFPSVYEAVPELIESDRVVLVAGQDRPARARAPDPRRRGEGARHRWWGRPPGRRRPRRGPAGGGVLAGRAREAPDAPRGVARRGPGPIAVPVLAGGAAAVAGRVHREQPGVPARRVAASARPVRGAARARNGLSRARYRSRVPFSLLPAIDLTAGGLGLYTPDGPVAVEAYGGDPLVAASAFRDAGATWLHVVDMDLAFTGSATNLETVRAIAAIPGVRAQASGGVRTVEQVLALREVGVARVVFSSSPTLVDEAGVSEILAAQPAGAVVVGIEVAEGRIRTRGSAVADLD